MYLKLSITAKSVISNVKQISYVYKYTGRHNSWVRCSVLFPWLPNVKEIMFVISQTMRIKTS